MQTLFQYTLPAGQSLSIGQGDLTQEAVDAIVNAANESLSHGGGVAGAIVRRGGRIIQAESRHWVKEHGRVPTGRAAITVAGKLPARYVIHAVGPVWGRKDSAALLASAVHSALSLADDHGLHSLALPGISSGIFGGPKDVCARIILQAALDYLQANPDTALDDLRFCNIDAETTTAFIHAAQEILG